METTEEELRPHCCDKPSLGGNEYLANMPLRSPYQTEMGPLRPALMRPMALGSPWAEPHLQLTEPTLIGGK